jgi:TonB family protein
MILATVAALALMCEACEERAASPFGFPFARAAASASPAPAGEATPPPMMDKDGPKTKHVPAPQTQTDDAPAISPKMIKRVEPVYPFQALRDELEGRVVVKFQIAPDGVPNNLSIVQSGHAVFDQPVLRALSQSRFEPEPPGKPIYGGRWFKQPYSFRMEVSPPANSAP